MYSYVSSFFTRVYKAASLTLELGLPYLRTRVKSHWTANDNAANSLRRICKRPNEQTYNKLQGLI